MMRPMFVFFLVSGFCSLAYEVIWLRLAMSGFGVTTPLVSLVLSVFMGGLGLGSWLGGRIARAIEPRGVSAALVCYAATEIVIGISGLVVPHELHYGQRLLAGLGDEVAWGSGAHHLAAGAWITLAFLPFCTAMGATFPLGIAALRRASVPERSFSYLYGANTLGATLGALISAFILIEWMGFRGTSRALAALNGLIAVAALAASWFARGRRSGTPSEARIDPSASPVSIRKAAPWLLFTTGLVSMGMEVVWVRQFSPFLGTVVYAFASILAIYLGATFLGAFAYRRWSRSGSGAADASGLAALGGAALLLQLLPLLGADPRLMAPTFQSGLARLFFSIAPLCAAIGFVTPMLVDRWSGGDPRRAGTAYAMNIIGCVIGPLLASFVLLPWLGERGSLILLSVPLTAAGAFVALRFARDSINASARWSRVALAGALAVTIAAATKDFEETHAKPVVMRDYAATVIASRSADGEFDLFVNGIGMTGLTTIAKMMVHFPLAHLDSPPRNVLVICFGMGTSFRSSVSWDVPTTVVDLIPSVPALFPYFHTDAQRVLSAPGARVVVDDGRRFLERSAEVFDVITIDPPPPIEAAGSSLLYSLEFYQVIKRRLAPKGILAQWMPSGDPETLTSVAKALRASFPHVRVFRSIYGWGFHFLASTEPIPALDSSALASRLPHRAATDVVEWLPRSRPVDAFERMTRSEFELSEMMKLSPDTPALTDDRPVNEYFFLRWLSGRRSWVQPR